MTALREVLAKFGFDVDTSKLVSANAAVDALAGSLGSIGSLATTALGALGLGAFKSQVDDLARESEELNKAAIKSGLGFEEFQKLTYTTGIGAEKLTMIFRKLQQTTAAAHGAADEAATGFEDLDGGIGRVLSKGQAEKLFKGLGVKASEDVGENFDNIAHALGKIQDPSKRAAAALQVFGRTGTDILPFLEKSPAELARLSEEFETFGGITEEQRQELKAYAKETKGLDLATKALERTILTTLLPPFTDLIAGALKLVTTFKKTTDTTDLLKVGIGILGFAFVVLKGQAAASAVATAASWALVALPFVALGLLIDDLIHFVKGDATTAIGKLYDKILGKGSGDTIAAKMRKDLEAITQGTATGDGGFADRFKGAVLTIGDGIKGVFTDTIPDAWSEFWSQMNAGLTGGAGGFAEYVKQWAKGVGISALRSILDVFIGLLGGPFGSAIGEKIAAASGLGTIRDAVASADDAEKARREKVRAEREDNLAVPTTHEKILPINELAGLSIAGVPTLPGSGTKGPVNKTSNKTVNGGPITVNQYGVKDGKHAGQIFGEEVAKQNQHLADAVLDSGDPDFGQD